MEKRLILIKGASYLIKNEYKAIRKINVLDVTLLCYQFENQIIPKTMYWIEIKEFESEWKVLESLENSPFSDEKPLTPKELHTLLNEPKTLLCENKE